MPSNIEVKARSSDLATLHRRLVGVSATAPTVLHQHDTFFDVKRGRLKMRCDDVGQCELIYYRRDNTRPQAVSMYFRQSLDDPQKKAKELEALFGVRQRVAKTRTVYFVHGARVHLDSVEGLGDFVEIEVPTSGEKDRHRATQLARRLMRLLDIDDGDVLDRAYAELGDASARAVLRVNQAPA